MKVTAEKNEKAANMIFASIYPLYWNRLEKNGRTREEFHQIIEWYTGYDEKKLQSLIEEKVSFNTFFSEANIHPNAHMIKGVVCGYRIEEIEDEFTVYKQCRRFEKLIDELARGRKMEKNIAGRKMKFNLNKSIELLQRTPEVYSTLFKDINSNWATINEGPDTWSAYNIIGHLIHGEKTDWIPRARIILGDQEDKTFIPYDRFAQEELYSTQSIEELLQEFKVIRQQNIEELLSWGLSKSDLDKTGIHPDLGEITLRQLIATWSMHDLVHLNQVTRVMVKHYSGEIGPFKNYLNLLKE